MAIQLYKDLNQFSPTQRFYSENERAVYQSLYNLLTTRPGERLFDPDYGISLEDELFELNDDQTKRRILIIINNAAEIYEPRIEIDQAASIVEADPDNYQIKVNLVFSIAGITDRLFEINETLGR